MKTSFSGRILLAVGLMTLFPLLSRGGQDEIVGTWELMRIAPVDIANSEPHGVTNTKLHFSADGKLFGMKPDEVSLVGITSTGYAVDGKKLTIQQSKGAPVVMTMNFRGADTLFLDRPGAAQRMFRRIASPDVKLEPKSLQLVRDPAVVGEASNVTYDEADYAKESPVKRIQGVWEVSAFRNVPRDQVPPYGFLNDIWVIKSDTVVVSRRNPPATDSTPFVLNDGRLSSSAISLGGSIGSKVDWTASFNEWGNLVLDSAYCELVLKLVSKNTSNVPAIPLKVVLLSAKP
jgi:hypothetical protein